MGGLPTAGRCTAGRWQMNTISRRRLASVATCLSLAQSPLISPTRIPALDKETAYGKGSLDGNSFRVSYSKDFDELNSRVTFAGYRFSEENFMTMSEYLDASDSEMVRTGNDKEMYTATYNQNFRDAGVSVYLNYTRHTYWDRDEQTNYNVMLSHYFNPGQYPQYEHFHDRIPLRV